MIDINDNTDGRGIPGNIVNLFDAASAARKNAHAPFTAIQVGAALRSDDGRIFSGCNTEHPVVGLSWCAEMVAIGNMIMAGERSIAEIVVVSGTIPPLTPCGACRQRIHEFAKEDTLVHVCSLEGLIATYRMGDLLPGAPFGAGGVHLVNKMRLRKK